MVNARTYSVDTYQRGILQVVYSPAGEGQPGSFSGSGTWHSTISSEEVCFPSIPYQEQRLKLAIHEKRKTEMALGFGFPCFPGVELGHRAVYRKPGAIFTDGFRLRRVGGLLRSVFSPEWFPFGQI